MRRCGCGTPGSCGNRELVEKVAQPVCEAVLDGYNGTILAYGQTGTGKTYTLFSHDNG